MFILVDMKFVLTLFVECRASFNFYFADVDYLLNYQQEFVMTRNQTKRYWKRIFECYEGNIPANPRLQEA